MLAPTHRAFSVPVTTGCMLLAYKADALFHGAIWQQSLSIAIVVVSAWIASTLPDWDRYIPFLRHRGLSHAIWIPLAAIIYAFYAPGTMIPYVCFGFGCGWFSHILGDSFSIAGDAWLYPFTGYVRYDSGAFVVKGPRGPFIPIYRSGEKTGINMKWVWYALGIVAIALYLGVIQTPLG